MPAVGVNPGGRSVKEGTGEEPAANSRGGVALLQDGGRRLPGDMGMQSQQEDRLQNQHHPQPGTRRDPGGGHLWSSCLEKRDFKTTVLELGFFPE